MKKNKVVIFSVSIMIVLLLASTSNTAYPISQNDSTDYSNVETTSVLTEDMDLAKGKSTDHNIGKDSYELPWVTRYMEID